MNIPTLHHDFGPHASPSVWGNPTACRRCGRQKPEGILSPFKTWPDLYCPLCHQGRRF